MSVRLRSEEDQGLDLAGHKAFSWGVRGVNLAATAWRKAKV